MDKLAATTVIREISWIQDNVPSKPGEKESLSWLKIELNKTEYDDI